MSWDLSHSCSNSLAPIRAEQAWQKKCQTKSSTKPQACGARGAGCERKGRKTLSGEEQTPCSAAARAGTAVGVLLQSSSTCSSFKKWSCSLMWCFPSVKWCVYTADLMYLFSSFSFPWFDLLLFCLQIKHPLLFSYSVGTHPFIYTWAMAECVLAEEFKNVYIYT